MSYPQTNQDLQHHLTEQLAFLETSIASYDDGNSVEAKRMAVILRILLHDTKKSKGLLAQLGLQDKKFYDSSNYEL